MKGDTVSITATTHLNFTGQAREALVFYAGVFGGDAVIRTYADFGMPAELPGADGVVYGQVASPNGFAIMAYDIPGGQQLPAPVVRRENGTTITDQPFFVALGGGSLDELTGYWQKLADGATIVEPLAASAFSAGFGMLTDRFGVTWAVTVS
jgi:PhnB protein